VFQALVCGQFYAVVHGVNVAVLLRGRVGHFIVPTNMLQAGHVTVWQGIAVQFSDHASQHRTRFQPSQQIQLDFYLSMMSLCTRVHDSCQ
jgi:hypothetical protein